MESDYFTAMDDLLSGDTMEESGSGMIGETDYNASCYYIYASLDTDILRENLKYTPDSEALICKAIPALIRTMVVDESLREAEQFCWKHPAQRNFGGVQRRKGTGEYGQCFCQAGEAGKR